MLGAIAGDMIGVPWEALGEKRYDFPLFTEFSRFSDDTVMTLAVAYALLEKRDYAQTMREFGRRYPVFIGGRELEHVLGKINGNGSSIHVDPSPLDLAEMTRSQLGTTMPLKEREESIPSVNADARESL